MEENVESLMLSLFTIRIESSPKTTVYYIIYVSLFSATVYIFSLFYCAPNVQSLTLKVKLLAHATMN